MNEISDRLKIMINRDRILPILKVSLITDAGCVQDSIFAAFMDLYPNKILPNNISRILLEKYPSNKIPTAEILGEFQRIGPY